MHQVLTAGQLLPGPAGARIDEGGLLIEDGCITLVDHRDVVERHAPRDAHRHHHPDGTLMPGLINAHVHLAFCGVPADVLAVLDGQDDAQLFEAMRGRAQAALVTGTTTVRDLGDRHGLAARLRDDIHAGRNVGPRIVTATAPITPTGGHCWFLDGEVDGPDSARRRVRANADAGADWIKIMVSGGGLTPGGAAMYEAQFDEAMIGVIVDEARRVGLPVAAHAHSPATVAMSVAAGVDTIEHCLWMTEGRGFEPDLEVIESMARQGIAVCPADSCHWRQFAPRLGDEVAQLFYGRAVELDRHGVRLIAGTDAGVHPFDEFPDVLARFHRDWGFSPARVIEMATTETARGLRLQSLTGELRPGAAADCLVVAGDPLTDIDALGRPELVVAAGRMVELDH